jgi:AcrR family transcriptional regulator
MKQRAERQQQTRQRIVDTAIELHQSLGPAHTTVTEVAQRAGVGRLTIYRHFPDEASLLTACSTHYLTLNPPPDPTAWKRIPEPRDRLRTALTDSYAYHRRTEPMLGNALRDVGDHPIMDPYHDHWRRAAEVLSTGWGARGRRHRLLRAAIAHALAFQTWRSLVRDQRLDDDDAVELMLRLTCNDRPDRAKRSR